MSQNGTDRRPPAFTVVPGSAVHRALDGSRAAILGYFSENCAAIFLM